MSTQTFEGKTVEEALEAAAASLGVEAGDLKYEVEEKAADFWGLGDTTFVVTVETAPAETAEPETQEAPEAEEAATEAPAAASPAEEAAPEAPAEASPAEEPAAPVEAAGTLADENAETLPPFFGGLSSDEDLDSGAAPEQEAPPTEPVVEAVSSDAGSEAGADEETPSEPEEAATEEEAEEEPTVDGVGVSEHAQKILAGIFGAMGFECEAEAKVDGDTMHVAITGGDVQYLLEGRGRGLAALELILNHSFRAYPERAHKRVRVDAGDFRSQRDDELRDMAYQVAHRAKDTGEPQQTAELNPYERRIIHLTLSEDGRVTTRSLGNGFLKAVNVIPTSRPSRRRR